MIEATEYIAIPPGGLPTVVDPPPGFNIRPDSNLVAICVTSANNEAGIRFLEWLRDKIRADQDAAKAFAAVRAFPDRFFDPRHPDNRQPTSGDPLPLNPTTISGLPVIDEGSAAPSAEVIALAETMFRIP